jgi:starvation-inducible DNA-binding protein
MKPNIGISEKNMKHTTDLLSAILASEMTLYIKTRKAHWNIAGESFMELHKLFKGQYEELEESIDEIAERIGKLGQKAIGTMQEFIKLSAIKENPGKYGSAKEILKELLGDHEVLIVRLRKGIDECAKKNNDAGTADFLTKLIEQHETTAWILRRYLN